MIIVGVGVAFFGVVVTGPWALTAVFVVLGSVTFLALGYVIASFAKTEDSANGMVSVIQFPMMFLSGTFFPIEAMPPPLQTVARLIPLTYLSDALRQVMVGGAAVRAAVGLRGGAGRLAGRLLRDRVAQVPLAVGPRAPRSRYQRSSWTISSSDRRPPASSGRVRSDGSAG